MSPFIEDDVAYSDDGQVLGSIHQADDGAMLLIGEDGTILAASTQDGQALDPSGYSVVDDGYDEMAQRIASLESQLAPPPSSDVEPPTQEPAPEARTEIDVERDIALIENNLELLERRYGRALSGADLQAVFGELNTQLQAGRGMNFDQAAADAGLKSLSDMSRSQRAEWVSQRWEDNNTREPTGEEETPQSFDRATRDGKVGYVMARLDGRPIAEEGAETPAEDAPDPEAAPQEAA